MQNRIRQLRRERGLTLEQVGRRVGLSAAQIGRIEKGERSLSVEWMEKIAAVLNVTPVTLLPDHPAGEGELVEDLLERKLLREFRKLNPSQIDTLMSLFRTWTSELRAADKVERWTA